MKKTSLFLAPVVLAAAVLATSACSSKKTTSDVAQDNGIVAPAENPAPAPEVATNTAPPEVPQVTQAPDNTTRVASLGASSSGRSR